MKILELFAGSRSIGGIAEQLGYEVFSVDWEQYGGIDLVKDIETLTLNDLPFVPDAAWASPDCTTYTIAGGSTHRLKPNFEAKTEYAAKCDKVNKNVLKLFKEIKK